MSFGCKLSFLVVWVLSGSVLLHLNSVSLHAEPLRIGLLATEPIVSIPFDRENLSSEALAGGLPNLAASILASFEPNSFPPSSETSNYLFLQGRALLRAGAPSDSWERFERARRLDPLGPRDGDIVLIQARAGLNAGKPDQAANMLQKYLDLSPDPAVAGWASLFLGEALIQAGKPEEAALVLRGELGGVPESQATYDLGVALLRAGKPELAADAFARALDATEDLLEGDRGPLDCHARLMRAESLHSAQRYQEAASIAEGLTLSECSREVRLRAHYSMGWSLLQQGKAQAASNAFKAYLVESDGAADHMLYWPARLSLGRAHESSGVPQEAASVYRLVAQEAKGSVHAEDALYCLAGVQANQENFKEAVKSYSEVLGLASQPKRLASAQYLMAGCYFRMGQFDRAVDGYVRVLRMEDLPEGVADLSRLWIGWSYMEQNSYSLAQKIFSELGETSTSMDLASEGWLRAADSQVQLGSYQKARQYYENARKDPAKNAQADFGDGWTFYLEGNFKKAETLFKKSLPDLDPGLRGEANLRIGDSLYNQKNFSGAAKAFQNAIRAVGKKNAVGKEGKKETGRGVQRQARWRLGWCYYRQSEYVRARQTWKYISKESDTLGLQARYWSAWTFFREKDFVRAAKRFEELGREMGTGDLALSSELSAADAWFNAGQPDKAIEVYRQVIARDPRSPQSADASAALLWAYFQAGQVDLALDTAGKFIKNYPDHAFAGDVQLWLGQKLYEKSEPALALARFKAVEKGAVQGGSNQGRLEAQSVYWQGLCFLSMRRLESAVKSFQRLQEMDVSTILQAEGSLRMGLALFRLRRYSQAVLAFARVRLIESKGYLVPKSMYNQGLAYSRMKRYEEAAEIFGECAIDFPDSQVTPKALLQQGLALDQMGNQEKAVKIFRKVVVSNDAGLGAEAQYYVAEIYLSWEKWSRAAVEFEKVRELFPDRSQWVSAAQIRAGEAWEMAGNFKKAVRNYKQVVQRTAPGPKKDSALVRLKKAEARLRELKDLENQKVSLQKTHEALMQPAPGEELPR